MIKNTETEIIDKADKEPASKDNHASTVSTFKRFVQKAVFAFDGVPALSQEDKAQRDHLREVLLSFTEDSYSKEPKILLEVVKKERISLPVYLTFPEKQRARILPFYEGSGIIHIMGLPVEVTMIAPVLEGHDEE